MRRRTIIAAPAGAASTCARRDAFPAPYQLDARRCISYLTIEHKGHIADRVPRRRWATASSAATTVSPCARGTNSRAARARQSSRARAESDNPPLAELLPLDDAAFRARFGGTPIKRTGRDRFLRNVLIAAGNSGDASLLPQVERVLDDASPLVRAMAVWALSRLAPERLASCAARASRRRGRPSRARRMDGSSGVNRLFCFGLGFSAEALAARLAAKGWQIAGTARDAGNIDRLRGAGL